MLVLEDTTEYQLLIKKELLEDLKIMYNGLNNTENMSECRITIQRVHQIKVNSGHRDFMLSSLSDMIRNMQNEIYQIQKLLKR